MRESEGKKKNNEKQTESANKIEACFFPFFSVSVKIHSVSVKTHSNNTRDTIRSAISNFLRVFITDASSTEGYGVGEIIRPPQMQSSLPYNLLLALL